VFGEFLIVLNCSVLGFWVEINMHSETEPPVRYDTKTKAVITERNIEISGVLYMQRKIAVYEIN
jgi:hypothetical protein